MRRHQLVIRAVDIDDEPSIEILRGSGRLTMTPNDAVKLAKQIVRVPRDLARIGVTGAELPRLASLIREIHEKLSKHLRASE